MNLILENIKPKYLPLIKELAKVLNYEVKVLPSKRTKKAIVAK